MQTDNSIFFIHCVSSMPTTRCFFEATLANQVNPLEPGTLIQLKTNIFSIGTVCVLRLYYTTTKAAASCAGPLIYLWMYLLKKSSFMNLVKQRYLNSGRTKDSLKRQRSRCPRMKLKETFGSYSSTLSRHKVCTIYLSIL